jgi:hypothetical protein
VTIKVKPRYRMCSVPGCKRKHRGLGYCHTHLECFKRTGDPIPRIRPAVIAFDDGTAICSQCGERKPFSKFKPQTNGKGKYGIYSICNQCSYRRYQKVRNTERYRWINEFKLSQGCVDCGYKEHAVALDFDHRPDEVKVMDIAQAINRMSEERLRAELAKCEVVCANCHRVRTQERRKEVMV